MKIQNELLTGVITSPEQLKKTGQAQPDSDFAAQLANTLAQGQEAGNVMQGIKGINPLVNVAALMESQSTTTKMFSTEENQFMDEVSELLDDLDSYSLALAGQGKGQAEAGLKSVYNMLDTISNKAQDLKGSLAKMGNDPALAGFVNELEVMAATEKFKLNRGDYTI